MGYKGHVDNRPMPRGVLFLLAAALLTFTAVALFYVSSYPGGDDDDLPTLDEFSRPEPMLRKPQSQLCERFKIYIYDLPPHIQMNMAVPLADRPKHDYKFLNSAQAKFFKNYGYAESFQVYRQPCNFNFAYIIGAPLHLG
jgi:hypothetical protein